MKSKQTLRFDGKIQLLEFHDFSRVNVNHLVNLRNQNKHYDLTEKMQLLEFFIHCVRTSVCAVRLTSFTCDPSGHL